MKMYITIILTLLLFASCKQEGPVDSINNGLPETIPALFASVDGNWNGIWVFDTDSLKIIDSMYTGPVGVPFFLEFSPNYTVWYSIWESSLHNYELFAVDAGTKTILRRVKTEERSMTFLKTRGLLVTYDRKIQFFNDETFSLVHKDSIGILWRLVRSPDERKLCAMYCNYNGGGFAGIIVYNLETLSIDRKLRVADSLRQRGMAPADLKISPDGRYLFLTVFNWIGGGGFGSFHAIDLTTDSVVAEYPCGKYSQMGVSPDSRYVYISDPAGYLYEMNPTGHLLRYDVHARTMELFIDWVPYNLTGGAHGSRLITDQIVLMPDNKTMFLTTINGETPEGKNIAIMKVDLNTKQVLGVYSIPLDHRGYITEQIRRLKLGMYVMKK